MHLFKINKHNILDLILDCIQHKQYSHKNNITTKNICEEILTATTHVWKLGHNQKYMNRPCLTRYSFKSLFSDKIHCQPSLLRCQYTNLSPDRVPWPNSLRKTKIWPEYVAVFYSFRSKNKMTYIIAIFMFLPVTYKFRFYCWKSCDNFINSVNVQWKCVWHLLAYEIWSLVVLYEYFGFCSDLKGLWYKILAILLWGGKRESNIKVHWNALLNSFFRKFKTK